MHVSKQLISGILGLTILALLILALLPSPIPVSATRARVGPFVESVEDEGRTQLRDVYQVSAPISGYLRRVLLEPGDQVSVDQVLFELEPLPAPALDPRSWTRARESMAAAQARLEAAEATLEARRTEHALARTEYERSEPLHQRRLMSAEERDRRLAQRDAAAAAEQAARFTVEVARFELEAARALVEIASGKRSPGDQPVLGVRAPIGGLVTRRYRCCEGPVEAGETLLEIGDLDRLEILVELLSVDAVRVRPGMRVELERWGGDATLEGRVRLVEPAGFMKISALGVEEQRVPVWVEILTPRERWLTLGEGYRVEARFILWEGSAVLQIPTSALFRHADGWALFVASKGRARIQPVELGRRSGIWTEIKAGIESGELVVTHPGDRVHDGTRIAVDERPLD